MNIKIELTLAEVQMAALVGVQRTIECIKLNASHKHGAQDDTTWQMSIEGALAECALAKHLNWYWSKGQRGAADVYNVDCRQTHHLNGCLILHPDDVDERKYYLLVGKQGSYEVKGNILAKRGKVPQYWRDIKETLKNGQIVDRSAYFVPQSALVQPNFLDD